MKEITLRDKAGSFERTYVLNPSQKIFTESIFKNGEYLPTFREIAFFGGVRAGKSFIYQFAVFYLCSKYPNIKVLYVRDTYDQLKDSVIQQFNDDFGMSGQFEYLKTERSAKFKNNSVVKFRAFDVDGKGILSTEYDVIAFCQAEDNPEDIFLLALSRLSGKNLPQPLLLTEGNPGASWPKKRYKDRTTEQLENDGILFIDVDTEENRKNLPAGYIEFIENNYPREWVNRFLRGGWENLVDAVFSEFRESKNIVDLIDPSDAKKFNIYQSLDYGWLHDTAILWAFVDYDGRIFIFDEWVMNRQTPDAIAAAAKQHGNFSIVADYAIKRPESDGKSIWDILSNSPFGLALIESNKQEMANILLANMLFKTDRLFISRKCVTLWKQIMNYKVKKLRLGTDKRQADKPSDTENDAIDAMLYLISHIEKFKTVNPSVMAYKKSLAGYNAKKPKRYLNLG